MTFLVMPTNLLPLAYKNVVTQLFELNFTSRKQIHEKVSPGLAARTRSGALTCTHCDLHCICQSECKLPALAPCPFEIIIPMLQPLPVLLGEHRASQGMCLGKQHVRVPALEEDGSAQEV